MQSFVPPCWKNSLENRPLVYISKPYDPSVEETNRYFFLWPAYLDIIACVACLSRSLSVPAIAHCSLRELPVRVWCREKIVAV